MKLTGGCYCGEVRYEAEGDPVMRGECHCRECQHITGGAENLFLAMPAEGFRYVKGEPKRYARSDLDAPMVREFCGTCGAPLTTRAPGFAQAVIIKVGSLDDPELFEGPEVVMWTADAPKFHLFPEGVPSFPGFPGR
jgi:hypothetical protein